MRHGGNVWEGQPADWLDFSANLRPEGTPAWVMDTMRAALSQACYYPDRAMRAARAGLALYLGVDESCVLPTAGGAAAIDLTLGVRRGAVHVQRQMCIRDRCAAADVRGICGAGEGAWAADGSKSGDSGG